MSDTEPSQSTRKNLNFVKDMPQQAGVGRFQTARFHKFFPFACGAKKSGDQFDQ